MTAPAQPEPRSAEETFYADPDMPVTFLLRDKATKLEVYREETTADQINAVALRIRLTWNAEALSGGVLWRHPLLGITYPKGLAYVILFTHPLTGKVMEAIPTERF